MRKTLLILCVFVFCCYALVDAVTISGAKSGATKLTLHAPPQPDGQQISEDFSTDTSSNWTEVYDPTNDFAMSYETDHLLFSNDPTSSWSAGLYEHNNIEQEGNQVSIQATFTWKATPGASSIAAVIINSSSSDTGNEDYIELYVFRRTPGVYLRKSISGSTTVLGSYSPTWGNTITIKLVRTSADHLEGWVNGTKQIDYTMTSTDITQFNGSTKTGIGIKMANNSDGTDVEADDVYIKTGVYVD